jgi:hypothetical protein
VRSVICTRDLVLAVVVAVAMIDRSSGGQAEEHWLVLADPYNLYYEAAVVVEETFSAGQGLSRNPSAVVGLAVEVVAARSRSRCIRRSYFRTAAGPTDPGHIHHYTHRSLLDCSIHLVLAHHTAVHTLELAREAVFGWGGCSTASKVLRSFRTDRMPWLQTRGLGVLRVADGFPKALV